MGRQSVATIDNPEFVNVTSISPLISKCEIKVLYVGQNRNHSAISKEVASNMAKTLPGCPIVGYYIENKDDFGDHGDQVVIDGEGVHFNKLTQPYGFVAPDAKIWFQKFEDYDDFGNSVVREYLMTEGYLWTGQFEECQRVLNCGNGQSMELDEKTLQGNWSTDIKSGIDFFIINDAIFSKLCILGEDVEPCFEGANITAPDISSRFSKEDSTDQKIATLFTMMEQLKTICKEGGNRMNTVEQNFSAEQDNLVENASTENQSTIEEFAKADEKEKKEDTTAKESNDSAAKEDSNSETADKNSDKDSEKDKEKKFAKADDEEEKKDDKSASDSKDSAPADKKAEDSSDKADAADKKDDEDAKKKYALLESELADLKTKFDALESECVELREFKSSVEAEQKDALISEFFMLSDVDKKDVVENKANYSLDEIKSKLSVICFEKKVNFDLDNQPKVDAAPATYNLNETEASTLPAWLQAVEDRKNK